MDQVANPGKISSVFTSTISRKLSGFHFRSLILKLAEQLHAAELLIQRRIGTPNGAGL